jgi:hypothetical protein
MAESPAHRFGQIIGDVLEEAIEPLLREFATEHGLYLDKRGDRPARRGRKVTWKDLNGNSHDLDYVLERGGTPIEIGTPVAFIETAWRRYTKHSRAKAQEIQGAILPLKATYSSASPFIGAVLAGVFTSGSRAQLNSLGFTILFFSTADVVTAFEEVGIDARSTEATLDSEFAAKVRAWEAPSAGEQESVGVALLSLKPDDVKHFMESLARAVTRQIESVRVLPLHGRVFEGPSVEATLAFIEEYEEDDETVKPLVRYEITINYENGDVINCQFVEKLGAIEFLRTYQLAPV